ncbi:MAG: glycerol-3-phosphate dehydrogenase/oxidase [Prolixibacteraceae bacterium]|nr:glycerol-3-phosphate dehydrogenase/oxidase [Prolixibacteraceae bacterium]MBN2773778.1 glycerol-3-phosphate dehydrogenase/oxidase [Prolixibacteraceae bacterium]
MKRSETIRAIEYNPDKIWDIVIIGGGATGLGAGVDAASRGYETLVLEKYDFAKGTSSRSTKLVHGGVRYLKNGDVGLVLEALHERGLLLQNAPHLVKNLKFIIPNYGWFDGPFYTVGLKVYDMMAGKLGLGPSVHITKEETMKAIPNLAEEDLRGGVIYHDGQFDDSRLAINLAQTITDNGGYVMNYCEVTGLLKNDEGIISGVECFDSENKKSYSVKAKVVVNATGIFVDSINRMDEPEHKKAVVPSQGVHIILDESFLQSESAIMIPKTADGRVLFAVPWHGKVVVGTTDTPVTNPEIEPRALEDEIKFILKTAKKYLAKKPKRKDVLSIFAGLRPLAAPQDENQETKEISRSHKLVISQSGLITMIGGKWTTYRKMGEDIIDKAILLGGLDEKECVTKNMPIHGYVKNLKNARHLYVYGSDIPRLKALMGQEPGLGEKIHEKLPYVVAEIIWAVREEMARSVEDFLARRTRALLLDAKSSIEMAPKVAEVIAKELGYNEDWEISQVEDYSELAKGYILTDIDNNRSLDL